MPIAAPPFCFDFIIHEIGLEVNRQTLQSNGIALKIRRFFIDIAQKMWYIIGKAYKSKSTRGDSMNIVIAIDSFKGSLSTLQAGNAAVLGIRRVFPNAEIRVFPIADGGEGTVDALVSGLHGAYRTAAVSDPLGREISANYGILPNGTAVIEMAAASGLPLLSPAERNPLHTTTYGFGQLIRDAIVHGCRSFILGIGGSATNDGGVGCLQALGFEFLDGNGKQAAFGAKGLSDIVHISDENAMSELKECTFHVACDVKNPLCGEDGCSAVFAPQKGADAEMIARMDGDLRHFAELTKRFAPDADADHAGAGAAGGLGFGLMTYLGAKLESGIDLIIRETGLEDAVKAADLVITGEGKIDRQSLFGKAISGVATYAGKQNVPVYCFVGCIGDDVEVLKSMGVRDIFAIGDLAHSPEDSMRNAGRYLEQLAEQFAKCF
jgi:glycerate kinase